MFVKWINLLRRSLNKDKIIFIYILYNRDFYELLMVLVRDESNSQIIKVLNNI